MLFSFLPDNMDGRSMVYALSPGKTVGAGVSCTLPIMYFHNQNRPLADTSAVRQ